MMVPLIQAVMQGSAGVLAQLGNPIRFFYGTAPLNTGKPAQRGAAGGRLAGTRHCVGFDPDPGERRSGGDPR
jgi:hypothetical protein